MKNESHLHWRAYWCALGGGLAYSVCTYAGHGRLLERAYLARQWRGYDRTDRAGQSNGSARSADRCRPNVCRVRRAAFRWIRSAHEIIAVYNDTPTFLNIGELNFVYNGNGWVHDLKNGSEILTQLDEICNS